jgi:hypothetical protein
MGSFLSSKVEPAPQQKAGDSYENIKSLIQPFDLILFRGDDSVSHLIQRLSGRVLGPDASQFSHCGIIVTRQILDIPELIPGRLYIFESTMSGALTDGVKNIHNHSFLGCQIRSFDDVVKAYDAPPGTQLNWCKLKYNPLINCNPDDLLGIQKIMMECYESYNGLRYEVNLFQLFAAMFPMLRLCRFNLFENRFMFCSELAANIYKKFGLFNGRPGNVVPADFAVQDADNEMNYEMFQRMPFHWESDI